MYISRFKALLFLVILIAAATAPVLAWDDTGHKITAYIAWQRMTPEVRERVIKILLAAPEDSQIGAFFMQSGSRTADTRKREYFMLMATWPDIVRDKAFETRSKKYHNATWHYSDTFWQWKDGNAVVIDNKEESGLALKKIAEFSELIRGSAPDAEKAVAIAWLEHLIGDIHQPLHSASKVTDSNPKGDNGGNLFLLTPKGTPRDKQENLHWFWDSIVVRYMPNTKDLCDADYLDPIAQDIMRLYPYDKEKDKLNDGKPDVWAKESFGFATNDVYKGLDFFKTPSDKYKKKAFEIAQERLALAGYRMGDLFNEAFGSASAVPTTGSTTKKTDAAPCKIIRKVFYPATQTAGEKQTLEIALLDLCPTQTAARPMVPIMIDGNPVLKEYDVIKIFKTEAEARKYATENNVTDISF